MADLLHCLCKEHVNEHELFLIDCIGLKNTLTSRELTLYFKNTGLPVG